MVTDAGFFLHILLLMLPNFSWNKFSLIFKPFNTSQSLPFSFRRSLILRFCTLFFRMFLWTCFGSHFGPSGPHLGIIGGPFGNLLGPLGVTPWRPLWSPWAGRRPQETPKKLQEPHTCSRRSHRNLPAERGKPPRGYQHHIACMFCPGGAPWLPLCGLNENNNYTNIFKGLYFLPSKITFLLFFKDFNSFTDIFVFKTYNLFMQI